jgi:HSP20 family protein
MVALLWKSEPSAEKAYVPLQAIGWQVHAHSYSWSPPTDVYETETGFVVRVEVAGMRQADFSVCAEKNFLVISGVRSEVQERRAYHQMEIRFGEFSTAIEIPHGVDISQTVAEYEDGFLIIILPKNKPVTIK